MALPQPMKKAAAAGGRLVRKRKAAATTIARGRLAKALVLRGSRQKTVGGLKTGDLMRNKRGRVVSKRRSARGHRQYKNIEGWVEAFMRARKALHLTGFVAINGKTLQGKGLYVKAKAILREITTCKTTASGPSVVAAAAVTGPAEGRGT